MLGALGALDFGYNPVLQLSAGVLINEVIGNTLKANANFVTDDDTSVANFETLKADRDLFNTRLRTQLALDTIKLHLSYLQNALTDGQGTQSARGIDPKGETIKMLGVAPVAEPPSTLPGSATPDAPTGYSDVLKPQATVPDFLPAAGTLGSAMSKLFWRGNLERTCRTSLFDSARELNDLHDKCIAGAAGGGNPDACTACTQPAEIHVPLINWDQYSGVRESKCSALGVYSSTAAPPGLPAYWFDNQYRLHGGPDQTQQDLGLPSFYVAMEWCTGTKWTAFYYVKEDNGWDSGPPAAYPVRDSPVDGPKHRRMAQAFVEDYSDLPANPIFPIVSAFDYEEEGYSGRNKHYAEAVAPAPVDEFIQSGNIIS